MSKTYKYNFHTDELDIVLDDTLSAKRSELDGRVKMIKSGTDVFIRTKWTSQWVGDYDLIQKMTLVTDTNWDNNAVNFGYIGILPTTTSDADVPTTSYTSNYQQINDDTCPLYLNGTYIGGNHGISWAVQVTVTGHDKTTVDEGSQWKSAAAHVFTLMRVVDENTIVLMTNNYGVDGKWNFYKWFSGSVLYHVSGATHTGNMTFSGAATHALKPSIKNHTRKVYINDTEVTDDGVYYAGSCDIVHTYDVNDAPSMVAYAQANIGNVDFTDASIENVGRVTITYRYHENGSCTVYQSFQALKALELGYVGFVQQAAVVIPTSGTLYQYVPKMADFTIGANTYTLKSTHNITSLANTLDLTTARWTSASAPPDRFFQYSKNSDGSNYYGMAVGYNRIGLGDPATRAANCSSAGQIATSKKVYPKIATGSSTTWADSMVPAGTVFDGVAFRCPINYEDHPNATNVSWYYLNDDCYLMIDYHSALSEYVALPDCLVGRKIEVIETDGITVGSEYVTHDGIYVTSAAYGTAVLRLYKEDLTLLTGYVPYLGATTDVDLGANNLLAKQVGIDSTPDRPLTIDTANSAVPAGEGSVMIYGGVNKERVEIRSAGGEPAFQSKRAGGTWAVPTKSILGARLFSLGAGGHDGTDWVAGAKGIIALYAAEAWEAGKNGTYFSVGLTPIGSSTRGDVFRIQNDGKVGIKTSAPDRMLEINTGAATEGIRISYNDSNGSAATYGEILLDSGGDLTITTTGGDIGFDNENLVTTGVITGVNLVATGSGESNIDGGLLLGAGTTLQAPLTLTAGTNTTAPVAGAIEFDGTDFYVSI